MSVVRLASAPVTWGVWERTIDREELLAPPVVLEATAGLGYVGIELGPLGYFGRNPAAVHERLSAVDLELAGAFVELHLLDPQALEVDLQSLDKVLAILAETQGKLVVADAGSAKRRRASGRVDELRRTTLDRNSFGRAMERLREVLDRSLRAGVSCAFHPHAGTYIESGEETERLLEATEPELGICLDTGHATIGGADPLRLARTLGRRLSHLHLKDVDSRLRERIAAGNLDVDKAWEQGLFCAIGEGEVNLKDFLELPEIRSYEGWVVLEQDRVTVRDDIKDILHVERANRDRVLDWCQWETPGDLIRVEADVKHQQLVDRSKT